MSDIELVQKRLTKLAEEMRGSTLPVSAFFLVTSSQSVNLMVQRLRALCEFGVTTDQIAEIERTVARALRYRSTSHDYLTKCALRFQVDGEFYTGDVCNIRNMPGKGFEVEIAIPGIIASKTSGFIDNQSGFWTAFLPVSFYR